MSDHPRAATGFGQPIYDGKGTKFGTIRGPGDVESVPGACPACGASREKRSYRIEG